MDYTVPETWEHCTFGELYFLFSATNKVMSIRCFGFEVPCDDCDDLQAILPNFFLDGKAKPDPLVKANTVTSKINCEREC